MPEDKPLIVYTSLEYLRNFENILGDLEKQILTHEKELKKTGDLGKADYQKTIREGVKIAKKKYIDYIEKGMSQGNIDEIGILDENI